MSTNRRRDGGFDATEDDEEWRERREEHERGEVHHHVRRVSPRQRGPSHRVLLFRVPFSLARNSIQRKDTACLLASVVKECEERRIRSNASGFPALHSSCLPHFVGFFFFPRRRFASLSTHLRSTFLLLPFENRFFPFHQTSNRTQRSSRPSTPSSSASWRASLSGGATGLLLLPLRPLSPLPSPMPLLLPLLLLLHFPTPPPRPATSPR